MSRDAMLSSEQFGRIVDNYARAVETLLHYQLALDTIARDPTEAQAIARRALDRFKHEPDTDG
jgi:hypothetical protein